MDNSSLPPWAAAASQEDLRFIRSFLLASGSLKALAKEYGVSYPTIRARLDRLIARLRLYDEDGADLFRTRLKELVADGEMDGKLARELMDLHAKTKPEGDGEKT